VNVVGLLLLLVLNLVSAQPVIGAATIIWNTVEKYSNDEDIPKSYIFGRYVYKDQVKYNLYRAENADLSDAIKLNKTPLYLWGDPYVFTDNTAKQNKTYYYYLTAFITPEIESDKSNILVLQFSRDYSPVFFAE
jgi:hypothetical protein